MFLVIMAVLWAAMEVFVIFMKRKFKGHVVLIDRKKTPINIYFDADTLDRVPSLRESFEQAAQIINEASQLTLVNVCQFGLGENVIVTGQSGHPFVVDLNKERLTRCIDNIFTLVHRRGGQPCMILIDKAIVAQAPPRLYIREAGHMLGHLLGLDHDSFTNSLMYYGYLSDEPELMENDLDFLRFVYGRDKQRKAS